MEVKSLILFTDSTWIPRLDTGNNSSAK